MDKLVRVGSKTTLQMHRDYERARGDLVGLFTALAADFDITRVLYPGSYIHLAPSFVFSSVTYVDTDKRAEKFFSDRSSIAALVEQRKRYDGPAELTFHHADYRTDLEAPEQGFDLLVSLYAGFVSQACKRYLRPSGWLVANNSHGDASMASIPTMSSSRPSTIVMGDTVSPRKISTPTSFRSAG